MPKSLPISLLNSLGRVMRHLNVGLVTAGILSAGLVGGSAPSSAQPPAVPIGTPLTFGMSPDEASAALGVPLGYVRGSQGNELLLALPNVKGSALTIRSDGFYLQFRRGRLTGWKGDWGTARPPFVGW
jgi:TctA family transporter